MDRKIETGEKESVGKYYFRVGEETCGPVEAELLKQKHHAGELPEETLFWKEGMTGWRFYRSVFDFRAVVGRVVSWLSGVRDSGVEWKGFFSQVWKRHTWTELREVFCAETEPGGLPLSRVNMSAPKPWLYTRILLWGIILSVFAFMSIFTWDPKLGVHLFMAVAALVTPLTVLVMAYELNTRRDLSTMAIVRALIGVVIIALPISGSLNTWLSTLLGGTNVLDYAWIAGFVEEPAKLITALVLAAMMRIRMNRVLRAVLLGCAVGAAFGYLETWTQYLPKTLKEHGLGAMLGVAALRALVASPGHAIWTGITVGAFAMAQVHWEQKHGEVRGTMFLWRNLLSWRFWRIAWVAIACHAIHNSGFVFADPVLYLFVGGVLWRLVRVGYVQMRDTRALHEQDDVAQFSRETWVEPLLRRLSIRFDGTMNRHRYWTLLLTTGGCLIGLGIVTGCLDKKGLLYEFLTFELGALLIWFLLLLCSMMTRRLHDMGKSGKHALYLVPLNCFFFLPAVILGFSRETGAEGEEEEDAPQPHAPVDNPEADPAQSMAHAALPSGFMPCAECCVPGAEEKWAHCDVCGGVRRVPLVAKSSNEHAVPISLPWFAWDPSFKGRLTRKTYWGMTLPPVAVFFLVGVVPLQDETNTDAEAFLGLALLFALFFFLVWGMGLSVRRLHDIGKSGWWMLLIVPLNVFFFLPSIILGLIDSSPGANEWGANAKARR